MNASKPSFSSSRARRWLGGPTLALALVACGGGADSVQQGRPDPLEGATGEQLYRMGRRLAESGDFTRAEQYLAAAIARGYPEAETLPALLGVCVQSSRLVAALSYAEPFLARHPEQWQLRILVASIHMGLEHYSTAQREFERVLVDAPEEPAQAHYFLGVLHRDFLGDQETAATHFQRYLALEPGGPHEEEARAGQTPQAPASASQRRRGPLRCAREDCSDVSPPSGSDESAPDPAHGESSAATGGGADGEAAGSTSRGDEPSGRDAAAAPSPPETER